MNPPFATPRLQRTLSAVFRFYDAFHFPPDDGTPPVTSPLEVSIPTFRWNALRVEDDATYRFSALTIKQAPPAGANLAVQVVATGGDYVRFDPLLLTLPLPVSTPPTRADFLIPTPLWPTPAVRPPAGETAVRGRIVSSSAQPVAGLKVEMWLGPAATPPVGTPFTRTNPSGDFLFRFPLHHAAAGSAVAIRAQVNGSAIVLVTPSFSIESGRTQIIQLHRT